MIRTELTVQLPAAHLKSDGTIISRSYPLQIITKTGAVRVSVDDIYISPASGVVEAQISGSGVYARRHTIGAQQTALPQASADEMSPLFISMANLNPDSSVQVVIVLTVTEWASRGPGDYYGGSVRFQGLQPLGTNGKLETMEQLADVRGNRGVRADGAYWEATLTTNGPLLVRSIRDITGQTRILAASGTGAIPTSGGSTRVIIIKKDGVVLEAQAASLDFKEIFEMSTDGQGNAKVLGLALNSIVSGLIADGAVTGTKIATGAVDGDKLAPGISGSVLAAETVPGDRLVAGTVTGDRLEPETITSTEIAAGAVGNAELAAGAVSSAKLQVDSVTATAIAAGAVGASEIADGSVGTAALANLSVTSAKIANGAVTSNELGSGAVTSTKLAVDSVGASAIAAGAVGNSELATDAVTAAKIATNAVTAAAIAAGAVGNSELGTNVVTPDKVGTYLYAFVDDAINSTAITSADVVLAQTNTITLPAGSYMIIAMGRAHAEAQGGQAGGYLTLERNTTEIANGGGVQTIEQGVDANVTVFTVQAFTLASATATYFRMPWRKSAGTIRPIIASLNVLAIQYN